MNQNFTQKSMEAIRTAQETATDHGHVQIEPIHILYALVDTGQQFDCSIAWPDGGGYIQHGEGV